MIRRIFPLMVLVVTSTAVAQTAVDFTDVYFSPEDYRGQNLIVPDVWVGEMMRMDTDLADGYKFFLRLDDDQGNSVFGIGDAFTPVLSPQLAREWSALRLPSLTLWRSHVYGQLFQGDSRILFRITKIEILSTTGNVVQVIE